MTVVDAKGGKVGTKDLSADWFGQTVKGQLLHEVVRYQRAKQRAGTHSTLTRAEMSGGGRKPFKQKGTGSARAGSNTSPLWTGGGAAHGPKPRSYEFSLNKKEKKQALQSALSARQAEGCVIAVDSFATDNIKTKTAVDVLKKLGISPRSKTLVVIAASETATQKSLRNIDGVKIVRPEGINVYDVLDAKQVLFVGKALEAFTA
ncbi:50S ribosomal protein L4 [bacterium]|nr:50S ribosomal protein L4 [bacterium]